MIPALFALAMVATAQPPAIEGVWHNPKNSVSVKTGVCGQALCGWVVRASPKAMADARDAGLPNLIGTELLRTYMPSGHRRWAGEVFVPDMKRTFGSTITLVDQNTLDVKACLVGGFLCKTQVWHRD